MHFVEAIDNTTADFENHLKAVRWKKGQWFAQLAIWCNLVAFLQSVHSNRQTLCLRCSCMLMTAVDKPSVASEHLS